MKNFLLLFGIIAVWTSAVSARMDRFELDDELGLAMSSDEQADQQITLFEVKHAALERKNNRIAALQSSDIIIEFSGASFFHKIDESASHQGRCEIFFPGMSLKSFSHHKIAEEIRHIKFVDPITKKIDHVVKGVKVIAQKNPVDGVMLSLDFVPGTAEVTVYHVEGRNRLHINVASKKSLKLLERGDTIMLAHNDRQGSPSSCA